MRTYTYTVNIESGEDGYYVVTVPALPGCVTQGRTYEEAVRMARECIAGFLEVLVKHGRPIPTEAQPAKRVAISVSSRELVATA